MVLIRKQDAYLPFFFFSILNFSFKCTQFSNLNADDVYEPRGNQTRLCAFVQSGQPWESSCPGLSSRQTIQFFTLPSKFVQPG